MIEERKLMAASDQSDYSKRISMGRISMLRISITAINAGPKK
jgi:hypothetical protein